MARILAVTWDGGGNLPPLLGIAAELRGRGHEVQILGHAQQRAAVESSGAEFVAYRHAREWSATAPVSSARAVRNIVAMFTEAGPGLDVAARLHGPSAPDLLLIDCMSLAALRCAAGSGVPTVALVHTFHRYLTRNWARSPIGLLATLRGLRPARLWNACDRVLVATDRDLDPAGKDRLPANVVHTGAVQPVPRPSGRSGSPLVLVSLSTIFYPAQAAVVRNVLDGLSDLDVRVVAVTGPSPDPGDLRTVPGVEVHRHLSHQEVMPTASLVIGHGGHATTLRALAHGVPMIVIPMDRRLDQAMIGRAVQRAGAGILLPTGAAPGRIREAARAMLADGPHRRAAAAVAARMGARDGAAVAAGEIESLLPPGGSSPSRDTP